MTSFKIRKVKVCQLYSEIVLMLVFAFGNMQYTKIRKAEGCEIRKVSAPPALALDKDAALSYLLSNFGALFLLVMLCGATFVAHSNVFCIDDILI